MESKLCKIILCLAIVLCRIHVIYSESICNGGHGDLLPDPKSCSNFYQCVWGRPVKKICSAGLHFDNVLKVCNWPNSAGCAVPQNTQHSYIPPKKPALWDSNLCNVKNGELVPDPSSNSNYYICFRGKPMLMRCRSGLLFDPNYKKCKSPPPTPVDTKNLLTPSSGNICEGKHGDLLPDPQSCSNFYQCVWNKPVLKICPSTLHFDKVLKVCNWPRHAGCNIMETTAPPATPSTTICNTDDPTTEKVPIIPTINPPLTSNMCEGLHGDLIPDPATCINFYVCVSGKPVHMRCPSGLHFDISAKVCNWPNLARCSAEGTTESSLLSTTDIEMPSTVDLSTFSTTISTDSTFGPETTYNTEAEMDKSTDFISTVEPTTDIEASTESTTSLDQESSTGLENSTSQQITTEISTEDYTTTDAQTSTPIEASTEPEIEITTLNDETTTAIGDSSTESKQSTLFETSTSMEEITTSEYEKTTLLETTISPEISTTDESPTEFQTTSPLDTTTGMVDITGEYEETTLVESTGTSEGLTTSYSSTESHQSTLLDTTLSIEEITTESDTAQSTATSTVGDQTTNMEPTISTNADTTIIEESTDLVTTTNNLNEICSPDDTDGFVRDPDDCHKYYKCADGNAEQFTCPHDWHFSPVLVGCFTQWLSDCDSDYNDSTPIIF